MGEKEDHWYCHFFLQYYLVGCVYMDENVKGKLECYNVLPLVHSGVQDSIVFKAGHAGLVCIELHNQPHARAVSVFLSLGMGEEILARNVVSWVFTIPLGSISSSVVNLFVAQQIWTGLVNVNLIDSRFCWTTAAYQPRSEFGCCWFLLQTSGDAPCFQNFHIEFTRIRFLVCLCRSPWFSPPNAITYDSSVIQYSRYLSKVMFTPKKNIASF